MLPLTEEAESSSAEDDLFSMADIKLEVMRARGAGGQVSYVLHEHAYEN